MACAALAEHKECRAATRHDHAKISRFRNL